jgi:hypothetical protein
MTPDAFRKLALAFPGAEEKSHFGKADFRVRNKIFATLPDDEAGVVKLTREQQETMVQVEPKIFSAIKGGWGLQGWTRVALGAADEITIKSALAAAFNNMAAKKQKG